jgi:molybdenum cofactor cytidylyltransferase
MSQTPAIATIILAAGGSSRLGRPKQLVPFRGVPLVVHAASTALAAALGPVIVVLGAAADAVASLLSPLSVDTIPNPRWSDGMGASLRAGVAALPPQVDAAIVMVCDQPRVTTEHLVALAARCSSDGAAIVGTTYDDGAGAETVGVPALFGRAHFDELMQLPADRGAKALLQRHRARLVTVRLPGGEIDVDTQADVDRLESSI